MLHLLRRRFLEPMGFCVNCSIKDVNNLRFADFLPFRPTLMARLRFLRDFRSATGESAMQSSDHAVGQWGRNCWRDCVGVDHVSVDIFRDWKPASLLVRLVVPKVLIFKNIFGVLF